MTHFAWQRPISNAKKDHHSRAHMIPVTAETNELLPAFCGKLFNPGFAEPGEDAQRCFNCVRRLIKIAQQRRTPCSHITATKK
jgi:hypothetical protein